MQELLGIIVRVSILYIYVLILLRLTGKRSIGSISPLDFLTALVVGDLFDNIFWGTSPLSSGLVAVAVIIGLHALTSFAGYSSHALSLLLFGSDPVRVVHNGSFDRAGMDSQRTTEGEVRSQLRLKGEDHLKEVREAFWELNGQLSVLKKADAKEAQKQDLDALRELMK